MRRLCTAAVTLASLLAPAAASAQVDMTCQLPLTRFDAATVNVAYPDDSAQYWTAAYQAVPGTRLRIDGVYPHARYMSFNVYDQAQRPLDALADAEIAPDAGSLNPFAPGADRLFTPREYSAFVDFGPKPATRAPNTMYTGTGQNGLPNVNGTLLYRIYIPDAERDEFGDVGLPTITLQTADGGKAPRSACATLSKPTAPGITDAIAAMEGWPSGNQTGGGSIFDRNPPVWRKFTNLFQAAADNLTDSEPGQPAFAAQRQLQLNERGGSGGFLSNIHNAYVQTGINKAFGRVLVTRFRAPTFADTRSGTPVMPSAQLRYWSFCENDPPTQRYIACLNDDRTVVGADGFVTYVVSTPANKPSKATPACRVNWLPWGPGPRGILIYRHMLPADFPQSIQAATFEQEAATMGDYFPVSRYYASAADYNAAALC